jgi:hypothetical protein
MSHAWCPRRACRHQVPFPNRCFAGDVASLTQVVNDVEARLALTEATVADYVRFFLHFLRAQEGAFVLSESSEEIGWSKNPYP